VIRTHHHLHAVRSLAALATVGLTAAMLAGCATSTETATETGPITMQVWGDTGIAEAQFEQFKSAFPAESEGLSIEVSSAGQNDADSLEKFRLALASGEDIPDILQLNYSAVPEFAEAGVLSDISAYTEPFVGNVTEAAQTLMKYNGTAIAFPYEVKEKLWFYRSDLFEQAGIDVTAVQTQADFIEAGRKLQAVAPNSYMWNLGPNPEQYAWAMIVSGNDARYSTQDPCEIVVGSDEGTAAAFQAVKDLRESGVVNTNFDDFSPEWQAALADGTIASTLLASWFPQFLQQYAPDLAGKWAVTTWPVIGGAEGGSESAGSVFVIPEGAKHPEAAAAFLANSLMTTAGAKAFVDANPGYIPNVLELLDDPAIANNEYFGTSLIEAYKAAAEDYKIFPFDPAALKETAVLKDQMANYLASSESDPSSFLQAAQDQLDSQVGCPWTN
jgi:ABC-type glycerol-3-phosphate transport system substrate-binding protein